MHPQAQSVPAVYYWYAMLPLWSAQTHQKQKKKYWWLLKNQLLSIINPDLLFYLSLVFLEQFYLYVKQHKALGFL